MSADWLSKFEASWKKAPARIDRLLLLREICVSAHSLRSKPPSTGWSHAELCQLEENLLNLRRTSLPSSKLAELIASHSAAPDDPAEALPLPREPDFNRPDRAWESSIVREALRQGWDLVELTARLPLDQVARFHEKLTKEARAYLFVEAASPPAPPPGSWRGRWYFVVPPGTPTPGIGLAERDFGLFEAPQLRRLRV